MTQQQKRDQYCAWEFGFFPRPVIPMEHRLISSADKNAWFDVRSDAGV